MDSNEFLANKVGTVIKVIRRYANRVESNKSVTDKYLNLLADSLESISLIKTDFSEKINALKDVMYSLDNEGVLGLAREYVLYAIEDSIEFDQRGINP